MPERKHRVFSARTTDEGLGILNDLRKERGIGWDELVIGAVCTHYGLDVAAMAVPKKTKPGKAKPKGGTAGEAKGKRKGRPMERTGGKPMDRRPWPKHKTVKCARNRGVGSAGVGFKPTTFRL